MAAGARLIFLGPPGAGKGTQAEELANWMEVPHISTGESLRSAIAAKTPLGQQAEGYVSQGELVPDELLVNLIRDRLEQSEAERGWILDGFPRTLSQAHFLESLLSELAQSVDYVINLEVPDEVLVKRLLDRGRQDDTEETIRRRLQVYRQQTMPLIDFYHRGENFHSIDGDRPPEEVTVALQSLLESK